MKPGSTEMLMTVREAADELGVNEQRIRLLCAQGRIMGARKMASGYWVIPAPARRIAADWPQTQRRDEE